MDCGGLMGDLWFCALAPGFLSHYTVPYDQVRFVIQIVMELVCSWLCF